MVIPNVQVRILRHREAKNLANCTANKWKPDYDPKPCGSRVCIDSSAY